MLQGVSMHATGTQWRNDMIQDIDYQAVLASLPVRNRDTVIRFLTGPMVDMWCKKYLVSSAPTAHLLRFKDCGFEYIFDLASHSQSSVDESTPADRVVVTFGYSVPTKAGRDSSRMRSFIGPSSRLGSQTDKGHFMSHASGGGLDVNLYPQRRDFNQRRKANPRSYVYYDMEKLTRDEPGTFYFNRPIYTDYSWRPALIEFGVVKPDGELWLERFEN